MTVLQQYTRCSDEEAVERSTFDLRWCAVLGKQAGEPLCAKSTFQGFRDRLIANEQVRALFVASIKEAKRAGLLKRGVALGISLDTKPMLGRGAVKDTYNLLGTAIVQLVGAAAAEAGQQAEEWARAHDFGRYFGSSLKGSAEIDWSDAKARQAFLNEIVVDVERLQRLAGERLAGDGLEESARKQIAGAAMLLETLLLQDVVETTDDEGKAQAELRKGTAADRIPSATDQDQRHGHKSKSKVFTGHKAGVAVDNESGIIVDGQVLAGNAGDAEGALAQVERVEGNTEEKVAQTTGDCAYGGGETRQAFADAKRDFAAKVPQEAPNKGRYTKSQFSIDLEKNCVECPGGKTTSEFQPGRNGGKVFTFGAQCDGCPLRGECTQAAGGRTIQVHPQEAMRAEARAYQETAAGRARLRGRVAVEHALARLGHLGIGQARYVGRRESLFQLLQRPPQPLLKPFVRAPRDRYGFPAATEWEEILGVDQLRPVPQFPMPERMDAAAQREWVASMMGPARRIHFNLFPMRPRDYLASFCSPESARFTVWEARAITLRPSLWYKTYQYWWHP